MDADDFVMVQATVRRSKVSEFYAFVSKLNAEAEETRRVMDQGKQDHVQSWFVGSPEEEKSAQRAAAVIYETITLKAREIVNYSLDYNDRLSTKDHFGGTSEDFPFRGHDLAKELNLTLPQLAGTLKSLGVRSRAVNRTSPIGSRPHREHGGYYWLDSQADLFFRVAREEYENAQLERERQDIRSVLSALCGAQEYEMSKIEAELEILGSRELSADVEKRRTELHEAWNWYQDRLKQGQNHLAQMHRDVEYLPPQEWRSSSASNAEEIARDRQSQN